MHKVPHQSGSALQEEKAFHAYCRMILGDFHHWVQNCNPKAWLRNCISLSLSSLCLPSSRCSPTQLASPCPACSAPSHHPSLFLGYISSHGPPCRCPNQSRYSLLVWWGFLTLSVVVWLVGLEKEGSGDLQGWPCDAFCDSAWNKWNGVMVHTG